MTARTLLSTSALACTLALAAPAQAAETPPKPAPKAEAAGLLGGLNDLLKGTVGALLDTTGNIVAQVDPTGGVLTDLTGQLIGAVDAATGSVFDATGKLLYTVDAATGLVLDPLGNVIGVVIPSTPTDPAPGGGSGGGGGGSTTAPTVPGSTAGGVYGTSRLSMAVSATRTMRLSTLFNRGVRTSTRCSATCGVLTALTVDGRTARRLGLTRGTQPVVIGSAVGGAGTLAIRVSARARRALSAALPTSRTRRSVRSKRVRAFRAYRSKTASKAARRKARSSYLRYRKMERKWIGTGRVKITISAVGLDEAGKTTTIHRRNVVVKR